jgi:RHS repeat-associated protein
VDWTYDALGRRVRQVRYVWTNSTWQVVEDLKLVSDPVWFGRHIAELNGTNGAVVRSYVWGLDVSESLDGAGGVGGLLWVRLSGGPAAGVHFVTYDGNGNMWTLVSASTGTETARYEYGPFGEPLRLTGAAAGWNPFRFSTKRTEDGTGLVLYEYRAYSPALGRWLSRDPILETAFSSLLGDEDDETGMNRGLVEGEYCFVRNRAVLGLDNLGLQGGLLCECGYTPPDKGFPSSKKNVIITDRGRAVCSNANLGEIVTFTHVGILCINRILVPRRCFDCNKRECSVRNRYQCGLWLGKHHWLFLDFEIVKRCP